GYGVVANSTAYYAAIKAESGDGTPSGTLGAAAPMLITLAYFDPGTVATSTLPWGGEIRSGVSGVPVFVGTDVFSASLTVPGGFTSPSGSVGSISVAEFGDPPTNREVVLSLTP